jgi:hypothetical protein
MDIFGTGQGSGSHAPARQESPEEQEAKAKAAAGGLGILLTLKYLPIVLLGLSLGQVIHAGARGTHGLRRAQVLTFGLSFFALLFLFAWGLPLQSAQAPLLGLLYRSDSARDAITDGLSVWNRFFPNLPILKKLRFDVRHMTYHDVTNYFWVAILVAALLVVCLELWTYFRPKDRTRREETSVWNRVCRIPADCVSALFHVWLTRWISIGRADGRSIGHENVRAILRAGVRILVMGLPAALLSGFVFIHAEKPMGDLLAAISFGPALGLTFGFAWGAIEWIAGGLRLPPALSRSREDEFCLGDGFHGRPYGLSEKNLSYHVEVIAPTGSGKTNLLKNLIADRIHRGHGLIFLDLKAEFQVVGWMMRVAQAAHRESELRLVSLANRELSVPYNPIKLGSAPEIHSQLMNSMSWSEDYYRKISSIALMTLLRGLTEYRDRTGELFHLGTLYALLNEPGLVRAFNEKLTAMNCPAAHDIGLLAEKLDRPAERDKLTGLVANLGLLIHSAAGPLISEDVAQGSFDFREAVDEGRITYVLMNSMKLRETASVFGKMILQDLMRLAGDRYAEMDGGKHHKPVTLIIDEFAAFAIPEFIEFMDRARGAGIGIVFAHQSRADLRAVSPEFQDRIEANSNTVIVSGVKSTEDAEYFAGQLGTRTVVKETAQAQDGFFGSQRTGMKSLRETEEYIVHPNRLKDLQQGEVFTVSRTVDPRWALVQVPQAHEFSGVAIDQAELAQRLKEIRSHYKTGSTGYQERYLDLAEISAAARGRPGLTQAKSPKRGAAAPLDEEEEVNNAPASAGPELWS